MNNVVGSYAYSLPVLPQASKADCDRAARVLKHNTGIVLGAHKEDMVARTLGLRAQACGLQRVDHYLDYLEKQADASEWTSFVNAFTINHTAFFREQHHFDVLGDYLATHSKPIDIWCSAASTGEEAYSIAMTVRERVPSPDSGVNILATDIDTDAIERAQAGIYTNERVEPVETALKQKYFLRGRGAQAGFVRVKPVIRNMVQFDIVNLNGGNWPLNTSFDVVFCRNTMIYFDKDAQVRILDRFAATMKPGGLLFVGHSENFSHLTGAFRLRGQTVYVRN